MNLIVAAKDALKRRIEITEAIDKSQAKLDDLRRNQPNVLILMDRFVIN